MSVYEFTIAVYFYFYRLSKALSEKKMYRVLNHILQYMPDHASIMSIWIAIIASSLFNYLWEDFKHNK